MLVLRTHLMLNLESLCAGTFRIAEDMKGSDVERLDKAIGLLEIGLLLATGANNDINSNEGIGHKGAYLMYLGGKEGGIVTAAHELEHSITTSLQRNMEVGHEGARVGYKLYHLIGEQIGLDG